MTVVSGSIRTRDDDEALTVTLSVWDTTITLRSDRADLGQWASSAVDIDERPDGTYEFTAEGDHLIFVPDDPVVFGALEVAQRHQQPPSRRSTWARRRDKKRRRDAEPKIRTEFVRDRVVDVRGDEPAIALHPRNTPRVTPEARREAATPALPTAGELPRPRTRGPARRGGLRGRGRRMWVATLDRARRIDLFGLDRVPVTKAMRDDPDHSHTWNHRVAPRRGPGSRICTVCGKVRH